MASLAHAIPASVQLAMGAARPAAGTGTGEQRSTAGVEEPRNDIPETSKVSGNKANPTRTTLRIIIKLTLISYFERFGSVGVGVKVGELWADCKLIVTIVMESITPPATSEEAAPKGVLRIASRIP